MSHDELLWRRLAEGGEHVGSPAFPPSPPTARCSRAGRARGVWANYLITDVPPVNIVRQVRVSNSRLPPSHNVRPSSQCPGGGQIDPAPLAMALVAGLGKLGRFWPLPRKRRRGNGAIFGDVPGGTAPSRRDNRCAPGSTSGISCHCSSKTIGWGRSGSKKRLWRRRPSGWHEAAVHSRRPPILERAVDPGSARDRRA